MTISSTSSGSGSGAFNIDGIASGLNDTSIINALLTADHQNITNLQQQETNLAAQDATYQGIKGNVTSLQQALATLMQPSSVLAYSATTNTPSGSPTILTATANSDATLGSFNVWVNRLATATTVSSSADDGTARAIGAAIDPGNPDGTGTNLAHDDLAIPVTAGTFTINGQSISITPSTDTLSQVISRINATSGVGVTASLANDAYGRPNLLKLTATNGQPIQLGSGTDTSNFLQSMNLAASGGTTATSNQMLGSAQLGVPLSQVQLGSGQSLGGASGSFSINGVAISWSSTDSLQTVINRVNASSANVKASYNQQTDQITLTNGKTGSGGIVLSDTSGTFLQAMGLTKSTGGAVTEQYGQTAEYAIGNSSNIQYSNSNTIINAEPGVSLSLQSAQASGAGPVAVTVSQDTQTAVQNVQAFVTAYNGLLDAIDSATSIDTSQPNAPQAAQLAGDPALEDLAANLRSIASEAASGSGGQYQSLFSIGISTGVVGSTPGSTNHLQVDTTALTTALQNNPQAVQQVLAGLTSSTTLNPDGSGNAQPGAWVASITGTPLNQVASGSYALSYDPVAQTFTSVFTPTGGAPQTPISVPATPGSTNSTLVPGLTIVAQNPLPSSPTTDTLQFNVSQRGVLQDLNSYVNSALGNQGLFAAEQEEEANSKSELDQQIQNANDALTLKRQTLQQQFTAMETALATLQAQGNSLLSSLGSSTSSSALSSLGSSGSSSSSSASGG